LPYLLKSNCCISLIGSLSNKFIIRYACFVNSSRTWFLEWLISNATILNLFGEILNSKMHSLGFDPIIHKFFQIILLSSVRPSTLSGLLDLKILSTFGLSKKTEFYSIETWDWVFWSSYRLSSLSTTNTFGFRSITGKVKYYDLRGECAPNK